jgi:hypothetical protein
MLLDFNQAGSLLILPTQDKDREITSCFVCLWHGNLKKLEIFTGVGRAA